MFDYCMFIVGEAFVALRRNIAMALAGITTGATALFLLGLLLFAFRAANDYAQSVPNMFDIRVFIDQHVEQPELDQTIKTVRSFPGVSSVVLVPRDLVWEKMRREQPELTKDLTNPLPNQLKVVVTDLRRGDQIASQIQALPTVVPEDGVHYLRQEQRLAIAILDEFKVLGLSLCVLLAFSTAILIYNTIRLTVLSRRLEIRIMQLVGASPAAIRIPFLIEGTLQGLVAGIFAASLLLLSIRLLTAQLSPGIQVGALPIGPAMAAMILVGGGYGLLCSLVAVRVPLQYR